jgi:AcrR family transcriptional regulator
MEQTTDPIQQQLITARRNQILDAATQVFAQKGFHRATIRDIAKTAGIADGTIYTYFANKSALLIGILDRLNQTGERRGHFTEAALHDLRSFLEPYMEQRMATVMGQIEVLRALLPEVIADPELRSLYFKQTVEPTMALAEQFFATRMATGQVRTLDLKPTVRAMTGMIIGVLLLRLLGDEYLDEHWGEMPAVITEILCDGLVVEGASDVDRA